MTPDIFIVLKIRQSNFQCMHVKCVKWNKNEDFCASGSVKEECKKAHVSHVQESNHEDLKPKDNMLQCLTSCISEVLSH